MEINGAKVKRLREWQGMTQAELAKGICTQGMICLIECDKANPSERLTTAIAERLETTVDELVSQKH